MPPKHSTAPPGAETKPRNRHLPEQLNALHALYALDQHPALELRANLGREISMETKTVSAWFQNKRASTKKRIRIPRGRNAPTQSTPAPDEDEYEEGEYVPVTDDSSAAPIPHYTAPKMEPSNSVTPDAEVMPQRARVVHSEYQVQELQRLWKVTTHPTTSQREDLAERINMRVKSVTNYFQNRRSSEKKRRDDEEKAAALMNARAASSSSSSSAPPALSAPLPQPTPSRAYAAFPPASTHPSLGLVHHAIRRERTPRSPSPSLSLSESPRQSISRRPSPYGSISSLSRPRRSRPEPYQLDALKALWKETANPSIEARTALSHEISMDLGKITNWFRNCRQKGVRSSSGRAGSQLGFDDDDDMDVDDDEGRSRSESPTSQDSRDQDEYAEFPLPLKVQTTLAPIPSVPDEGQELWRRHFIGPKDTNQLESLPPILNGNGTPPSSRWQHATPLPPPPSYYRLEATCEPPKLSERPREPEQQPTPYYVDRQVHATSTAQFGDHYNTNSPLQTVVEPAPPRVKLDDALLLLSFHLHAKPGM